ncbi:MAG TPA: ABC transporter permease [Candidatus Acidoferrum sp.]|jgi:predicted permease
MNWLTRIFTRRRIYEDLSEEVRAHLEEKIEELVAGGMSRADASAAARRQFGNVTSMEEAGREVWRWPRLEEVFMDLRYGLRVLRKSPGFSAVAILTLALGIGANTAIFSVVNAVVLQPPPFQDPNRLMMVWHTPPQKSFPGVPKFVVSAANFLDWRSENHVFSQMSAVGFGSFNLSEAGNPASLQGRTVSYDFFSMLGVAPIVGRSFVADDDQTGSGLVVIISDLLWKTRFGGAADILKKTIKLDDRNYSVIGVMPEKFDFPFQAQLWMPNAWSAKQSAVRGNHNYLVIARLKPGVDQKTAQAEMDTISNRLAQEYPVDDAGWGAAVLPLGDQLLGSAKPALLILLGAVAFVLLIACTNVANLTLAKALGRRKEIAIRVALGASRGRVIRQVLIENLLLSVAGGLLGLGLAHFVVDAIAAFIGPQLPLSVTIGLDGWVLGFTLMISVLTGILAGVAPSWHLLKTNVNASLKQGVGRTDSDAGGGRARSVFVVAEVTLSLVLLVGAGLTIRTLALLRGVDAGFDAQNVLTVPVSISSAKFPTVEKQNNFFNTVLAKVRTLPGVVSAGAADALPVQGGSTQPVLVEGQPVVTMADQPEVPVRLIAPGYLSALHISLKQGRDFNDADKAESLQVVLVSEAFARRFWPNENPLGKHVTLTFSPGSAREVVGVVSNVRLTGLAVSTPVEAVYQAMTQSPRNSRMTLAVRTSLPPTSLTSAVTDAVHSVDADTPVEGVLTMQDILDQSLTQQRLSMTLLAAFAGLALLLAAIGIYGVQAYSVRQRIREVGIRIAMGARTGDVLRVVMMQGLKLSLLGVVLGLAASMGLSRLITSQLYGLTATDPVTFAGVSGLLLLVASAACFFPARRATRVDPIVALRDE